MNHLTLILAQAIEDTLGNPRLLGLAADTAKREIVEMNRRAVAQDLAEFVQPPRTWGDGCSITFLEETGYLGHLDPAFRDEKSPHFLGRHWPSDTPAVWFKPIPLPPSLRTPYFDPRVRIPLYRAALGDELVVSHHWNFDSLKLSDVEHTRALMEILYQAPPMYHLNRETWPQRRDIILHHVAFWNPLHRQLAAAPLTRFGYVTKDRLVQRTTFQTPGGEVTITVNFSERPQAGFAPLSATVAGGVELPAMIYRRTGEIGESRNP